MLHPNIRGCRQPELESVTLLSDVTVLLTSTLDGDRQSGIRADEHYGNHVCPAVDP